MALYVKQSGVYKTVSAAYVNVSGVWKSVSGAYNNVLGTWKASFSPNFTAGLTPSTVNGECVDSFVCEAISGSVNVTVTEGGIGPFTYLWEYVSGDAGISANSPTSSDTTFSLTEVTPSSAEAVYRCKVTDAADAVAYTGNVTISLNFSNT